MNRRLASSASIRKECQSSVPPGRSSASIRRINLSQTYTNKWQIRTRAAHPNSHTNRTQLIASPVCRQSVGSTNYLCRLADRAHRFMGYYFPRLRSVVHYDRLLVTLITHISSTLTVGAECQSSVTSRTHLVVVQKKTGVGHSGIVDVLECGKIDEAVQVHQNLRMLVDTANLQRTEFSV